MPDALREAPKLPTVAGHIWGYWNELHRRRGSNGFGPNPLDDARIDAWAGPRFIRLDLWEREAILAIDDAYLASVAREAKRKPT